MSPAEAEPTRVEALCSLGMLHRQAGRPVQVRSRGPGSTPPPLRKSIAAFSQVQSLVFSCASVVCRRQPTDANQRRNTPLTRAHRDTEPTGTCHPASFPDAERALPGARDVRTRARGGPAARQHAEQPRGASPGPAMLLDRQCFRAGTRQYQPHRICSLSLSFTRALSSQSGL